MHDCDGGMGTYPRLLPHVLGTLRQRYQIKVTYHGKTNPPFLRFVVFGRIGFLVITEIVETEVHLSNEDDKQIHLLFFHTNSLEII